MSRKFFSIFTATKNLTFCQAQYIIHNCNKLYYSNVIKAKSTDILVYLIFFLRQGDELETFFIYVSFMTMICIFIAKKLTLNHIYNTSIICVLLYIELSSPGPSDSHQIQHMQLLSPSPPVSHKIQHSQLSSPGPSVSYQINSTQKGSQDRLKVLKNHLLEGWKVRHFFKIFVTFSGSS